MSNNNEQVELTSEISQGDLHALLDLPKNVTDGVSSDELSCAQDTLLRAMNLFKKADNGEKITPTEYCQDHLDAAIGKLNGFLNYLEEHRDYIYVDAPWGGDKVLPVYKMSNEDIKSKTYFELINKGGREAARSHYERALEEGRAFGTLSPQWAPGSHIRHMEEMLWELCMVRDNPHLMPSFIRVDKKTGKLRTKNAEFINKLIVVWVSCLSQRMPIVFPKGKKTVKGTFVGFVSNVYNFMGMPRHLDTIANQCECAWCDGWENRRSQQAREIYAERKSKRLK